MEKKHASSYNGGLVGTNTGELDINVNEKNVGRSLRFFDTIIKVLKARGHEINIKYSDTFVVIQGEEIKLKLREKLKREKVKNPNYSWDDTVYHATGIMYLKVGRWSGEFEFKDGKKSLEEQLPSIIAKLELYGEKLKAERLERDRYWAEQDEKKRIHQEFIKKQEKDQNDFKELLQQSVQWQQAAILRSYLEVLKEQLTERGELSEEQISWFNWAQGKTNRFDPLSKNNSV